MGQNLLKKLSLINDRDCENITAWLKRTGRYDLLPNKNRCLTKAEVAFLDIDTIRRSAGQYDKIYNILPDRSGTVSYTNPTWEKLFPGEVP